MIGAATPSQARAARLAYRRFGKGRHPARLNLGDCFAYALARETGEPLLCKGEDFPPPTSRWCADRHAAMLRSCTSTASATSG